jgi:hypothetical protein
VAAYGDRCGIGFASAATRKQNDHRHANRLDIP